MIYLDKILDIKRNIWGLEYKFKTDEGNIFFNKTLEIRMNKIAQIILENDPDIICFQEMTSQTLKILSDLTGNKYPFKFEPYFDTKKYNLSRGRTVEVYLFSKFLPKSVKHYDLSGNLGYNNAVMIAEFDNLVVGCCYLQAGSKFSPGQSNYWMHYARCRMAELRSIKTLMSEYTHTKAKILVGDFNFHIGEDKLEWPENFIIDEMQLIDAWKTLKGSDLGLTEDTAINKMRWNVKFMEKHFRYDGIFFSNNITPTNIKLLGNDEIPLSREDSELFIKYRVPNVPKKEDKIIFYNKSERLLSLYPSDHFSVMATFELI